jgi:hypothetical protein
MAKNPIFAILWIALLFFIAWPVAGICCGVWILIQVNEVYGPREILELLSLESMAANSSRRCTE